MLKKDFNDYLKAHYQNIGNLNEVTLFRALIDVLCNTDYSLAIEKHSTPGMVNHDLVFPHCAPDNRRCEIADVLMLFFDSNDNLRYTFVQNKRDKRTKYSPAKPLTRVSADPVQWDLLHYRSVLTDSYDKNLPKDCLSSALLNSAATYGIFVNDAYGGTVDMTYSIARDLACANIDKIPEKSRNRKYQITSDYGAIKIENGYAEIQGTKTLDEFEIAARTMLVGSPIDFGDRKQRELASVLLSSAITRLSTNQINYNRNENAPTFVRLIHNFAERNRLELYRSDVYLSCNLVIMKSSKIFYFASDRDEVKTEFVRFHFGEDASITYSLKEFLYNLNNKSSVKNSIFIIDSDIYENNLTLINDVKNLATLCVLTEEKDRLHLVRI